MPLRSWGERVAFWRRSARRPAGWVRPALAVGVGVAVLVAVGLAFLRASSPAPRLTLPRAQPGSAPVEGVVGSAGPAPASASPPPPVTATVHVAGQVTAPGLYSVPAGARVADVIVAAGAASPEADLEQVNLAARVSDGERIYVPRKGETPPAVVVQPGAGGPTGAGRVAGGPVDLNTATAEQLDALPGVGPATSAAIVTYRTGHGRFRSVTELLQVPGIGPSKLEALRPLVKI